MVADSQYNVGLCLQHYGLVNCGLVTIWREV